MSKNQKTREINFAPMCHWTLGNVPVHNIGT